MTTAPLPDGCHELPAVLTVATARVLAPVSQVVPTVLLEAAAAVLACSSAAALAEVHAHPRRRGNGARRAGADADEELATLLLDEVRRRRPKGVRVRANAQIAADALPALGPGQWMVVASLLDGWVGTLDELWMVAQATVHDEPPIDVDACERWSRRRSWARKAASTRAQAQTEDWFAQSKVDEAATLELRAAQARRDAEVTRGAADRLRTLACIHDAAVELSDAALARYERLVDTGTPPARALQQARETR